MHRLYYALPSKSLKASLWFGVVVGMVTSEWDCVWYTTLVIWCYITFECTVIDSQLTQSPSTITDSLYEDFDGVSEGTQLADHAWDMIGVSILIFRFRWYVPLPWERKILGELWLEICSWFHGSVNVTQYWRKLILQWKPLSCITFSVFNPLVSHRTMNKTSN